MTRRVRALLAVVLAALALGAAGCTARVAGEGRIAASAPTPEGTEPRRTPPGPGGDVADVRACPQVVDAAAGLAYPCLDPSFREVPPTDDPSFADSAIRMAAYTETTWLAAQQSGSLAEASTTAQFTAILVAAQQSDPASGNYGPGATASTVLGVEVDDLGLSAYRIDLMVTLDPAYRQQRGLAVRAERLCVVAVEVQPRRFSALTISVPDTHQQLWAGYDAVVAQLRTV